MAAYLCVIAGSPKNIHAWTPNTRIIWRINLPITCLRRYSARSIMIRMNCTSSIPRNGIGTYQARHAATSTNDINITAHCSQSISSSWAYDINILLQDETEKLHHTVIWNKKLCCCSQAVQLCLSAVSFNSTIPRAQSFIVSYSGFRSTNAYK